jgi:hypothetical protein
MVFIFTAFEQWRKILLMIFNFLKEVEPTPLQFIHNTFFILTIV